MKKIKNNTTTITNVLASSGSLDIELIESLGTRDYKSLMDISASLAEDYGEKYVLTKYPKLFKFFFAVFVISIGTTLSSSP